MGFTLSTVGFHTLDSRNPQLSITVVTIAYELHMTTAFATASQPDFPVIICQT